MTSFEIDAITNASWAEFGPDGSVPLLGTGKLLATHDLQVVRPALLYADKVTLHSGNYLVAGQLSDLLQRGTMPLQALRLFSSFVRLDDPGAYDYLGLDPADMPSWTEAAEFLDGWKQSVEATNRMSKEAAQQETNRWFSDEAVPFQARWSSGFVSFLDAILPALQADRDALVSPELQPAIDARILDIQPHVDLADLDLNADEIWFDVETVEAFRDAAFESVSNILNSGTSTPLLDPWGAEVARRSGTSSASAARASAAKFGSTLLGATTGVGNASVLELLDLREEFKEELVRFRGAMMDASIEFVESEADDPTAWLLDFRIRRIEPALVDIADSVAGNRYASELLDVVRDPKAIVAPAGTLLLAPILHLAG